MNPVDKLVRIVTRTKQRRALYIRVFDSPDGKRVLEDLMATVGITRPQFPVDTNKAMIRQGEQRVVYNILKLMNSKPEDMLRNIEKEMQND